MGCWFLDSQRSPGKWTWVSPLQSPVVWPQLRPHHSSPVFCFLLLYAQLLPHSSCANSPWTLKAPFSSISPGHCWSLSLCRASLSAPEAPHLPVPPQEHCSKLFPFPFSFSFPFDEEVSCVPSQMVLAPPFPVLSMNLASSTLSGSPLPQMLNLLPLWPLNQQILQVSLIANRPSPWPSFPVSASSSHYFPLTKSGTRSFSTSLPPFFLINPNHRQGVNCSAPWKPLLRLCASFLGTSMKCRYSANPYLLPCSATNLLCDPEQVLPIWGPQSHHI